MTTDDDAQSLVRIAAKLRDKDLDAALAAYREPMIARLRVYGILFAACWALLWYTLGPSDVPRTPRFWNYPQAVAVLPYVTIMLVIATAWWIAVKREWVRPARWLDAVGAVANILGVAILLYRAFDLMIGFICYLPIISINVGARFNRIVFYLTIFAAAIIVQIAAPEPNYWVMRPHFALFALILLVLMPMSVVRLLNTVRAVSEVALKSRDAQSRFVATMSHEFRTPLNSVINNAVLIDVQDMTDSQKRIVDALTSAATALRHRVNEVLDVRAIESGSLTIVSEPFQIAALLKTIKDMIEPQAAAKSIRFTIKSDATADLVLCADPTRLEQVITNLATNAVKFTPAGGCVEIREERDGADAGAHVPVRFVITDDGPGIPESERPHIWRPFHQISSGDNRRHGGVGLGLFLVKSILSYIGGRVEYAPRDAGGSIFTVHVALERAAAGVVPAANLSFRDAAHEHRRRMRSMHCLVIDDAPSNLETIGRLLATAGHTMIGALSGADGIEKARQTRYDVIFLDLHMPDLTGYDVLRAFKEQGCDIPPIYMLSADAAPDAVRETQALGASGYLTKPINPIKLLALLETVADGSVIANMPRLESMTGMAFIEEAAGVDAARDFARMCLEELADQYRTLCQAVADGRHDDASFAAHGLKNAFLNVGVLEGARRCDDLRAELNRWRSGASHAALDGLTELIDTARRRLAVYVS